MAIDKGLIVFPRFHDFSINFAIKLPNEFATPLPNGQKLAAASNLTIPCARAMSSGSFEKISRRRKTPSRQGTHLPQFSAMKKFIHFNPNRRGSVLALS